MAFVATFNRLDADEIEREVDPSSIDAEHRSFHAGRQLLERLQGIVDARGNILLETTLASRAYAQQIPDWQAAGYRVTLIYLRLPSVAHSIARVARRVASGGHDIPEAAIRRRWQRSLDNLENLYKPIVDEWYVWDSIERDFVLLSAWNPK